MLAALSFSASAAFAQYVTNVFHGTVTANGANGPTTNDFVDPFQFFPSGPFGGDPLQNGGSSLIGKPFTLTMSIDVSNSDGIGIGNAPYFVGSSGYNYLTDAYGNLILDSYGNPIPNGNTNPGYPYGGYYPCCSPMISSLTINNQTVVFDAQTGALPMYFNISTDGSTYPNELQLQSFYWASFNGGVQYFGLAIDLVATNPIFGSDFTTALPTLLENKDYTVNFAAFYTIGGEIQNLDIANINGPAITTVPEPSTWAMMLGGFTALALASRRRRTNKNPAPALGA
jgi:hypothetical protein